MPHIHVTFGMYGEDKLTWTSVGHGEEEWAFMLLYESLVLKLGAINGFTAGAIAVCKITTLSEMFVSPCFLKLTLFQSDKPES